MQDDDRDIALRQELLAHLDRMLSDWAAHRVSGEPAWRHVAYVHAVVLQLERLKVASGPRWQFIWPQLVQLLAMLARTDDPIRFIALANRLSRAFEGTPADALSRELRRKMLPPEAPPDTRRHSRRDALLERVFDRLGPDPEPEPEDWSERLVGSGPDGGSYREPSDRAAKPGTDTFHFVLEGPSAGANWIVARTSAALRFQFGPLNPAAIGATSHPALSDARQADVDIQLAASATGAVHIDGAQSGLAQFQDGKLVQAPVFTLVAGKPGRAAVHIDYVVRGELVHQSEIALRVRAKAPLPWSSPVPKPMAPAMLAELPAASAMPARRIRLGLDATQTSFAITVATYSHGEIDTEARYSTGELDSAKLAVLLKQMHGDLARLYDDAEAWQTIAGQHDDTPEIVAALAHALHCTAAAGNRLYRRLCEAGLKDALRHIEAHAVDGCTISIATADVFLPWEILYPLSHSANMVDKPAVDPALFWGSRYAIETDQRGEHSHIDLRKRHLQAGPRISLNLNNAIKSGTDPRRQPATIHDELAKSLQAQSGLLDGVQHACKQIRQILQKGEHNASLIYLYCHGSAPDEAKGQTALLQLAEAGCALAPEDLETGKPQPFPGAPIVFLNACKAGASSPQVFDHFLRSFHRRGALGMIATTAEVPIVFGAHFGARVIDAYVRRSGSLSQALLALRRQYVAMGNPVPLFYSLQCHLDVPFPTNVPHHA